MARRLFISTTNPASGPAVTPSSSWENTAQAGGRRDLTLTKLNQTVVSSSSVGGTGSDPNDVLIQQFISPPLEGAQTITGTIKGQMLAREGNAANNARAQIVVRVVSGDGATVRGTLLDTSTGALSSEFDAASAINRKFPLAATSPATLTSVNAQDGDRISIEVGVRFHSTATSATSNFVRMSSNSGGDLPEDETTNTTTLAPWFEFSQSLVFEGDAVDATAVAERATGTFTATASAATGGADAAPARADATFNARTGAATGGAVAIPARVEAAFAATAAVATGDAVAVAARAEATFTATDADATGETVVDATAFPERASASFAARDAASTGDGSAVPARAEATFSAVAAAGTGDALASAERATATFTAVAPAATGDALALAERATAAWAARAADAAGTVSAEALAARAEAAWSALGAAATGDGNATAERSEAVWAALDAGAQGDALGIAPRAEAAFTARDAAGAADIAAQAERATATFTAKAAAAAVDVAAIAQRAMADFGVIVTVGADTFTRPAGDGLGATDAGDVYTVNETGTSEFATTGTAGTATLREQAAFLSAGLLGKAIRDTDLHIRLRAGSVPTTDILEVFLIARGSNSVVTNDGYGGHCIFQPNTQVHGNFNRISATGVRTPLPGPGVLVPGSPAFTPDVDWDMRFQCFGAFPTTLRLKIWRTSDGEPSAWTFTTTDSTGNQFAGAPGFRFRVDTQTTVFPYVFTFDDWSARDIGSTATLVATGGAVGVAARASASYAARDAAATADTVALAGRAAATFSARGAIAIGQTDAIAEASRAEAAFSARVAASTGGATAQAGRAAATWDARAAAATAGAQAAAARAEAVWAATDAAATGGALAVAARAEAAFTARNALGMWLRRGRVTSGLRPLDGVSTGVRATGALSTAARANTSSTGVVPTGMLLAAIRPTGSVEVSGG